MKAKIDFRKLSMPRTLVIQIRHHEQRSQAD